MKKIEKRELTAAEKARLAKLERTRANRRGRKAPAAIPHRLVRTNAFAAKRRGLITDSSFKRLYVVPNYSVIQVSGRELGSQHRDVSYAIFAENEHLDTVTLDNPRYNPTSAFWEERQPQIKRYVVTLSWRQLLTRLGVTPHQNNLLTVFAILEDIQKVLISVFEGKQDDVVARNADGSYKLLLEDLEGTPGYMRHLYDNVAWEGLGLDDLVQVTYGAWAKEMMHKSALVSLDADVHFALKKDYAKSIWPFIDSQPNYRFLDEDLIAHLIGRDFPAMTAQARSDFRRYCVEAFDDMQRAGGLTAYRVEQLGAGRAKTRRYHYTMAKQKQMELGI